MRLDELKKCVYPKTHLIWQKIRKERERVFGEDCAKSNEYSQGSLFLRSNLRGKFGKSITKTNK